LRRPRASIGGRGGFNGPLATLAYDEFLNTLDWPLGRGRAVFVAGFLFADRGWRQPWFVERRYAQWSV